MTEDPKNVEWDKLPNNFQELMKTVTILSIRAMLARLQTVTEVNLPKEIQFESLDIRMLHAIEQKVRDTLRTLGGAR